MSSEIAALTIRKALKSDLEFISSSASAMGWTPGLHDIGAFYNFCPDGFFVGCVGGQVIGCISAVTYNQHYGFIGYYIVAEEHRGKGYGIALWNKAMDHLGKRTVGLDGVPEQQLNYQRSGFEIAYHNSRYRCRGLVSISSDSNNTIDADSFRYSPASEDMLVPIKTVDLHHLAAYDSQIYPVERSSFLELWRNLPDSVGIVATTAKDGAAAAGAESNPIRGFGMIRKCDRGWRIGPLFADTTSIFKAVLNYLLNQVAVNEEAFIDVPCSNTAAVQWMKDNNFEQCFDTARMYLRSPPVSNVDKIWGVSSLELG